MKKGRLEAFSKIVLAIINAIMLIALIQWRQTTTPAVRQPLDFVFLSYALSFFYSGIYWQNYQHLLQTARRVDRWVLWANLHLLFWLSLIPFTTAWMGKSTFSAGPVALYGINLLLAAVAYYLLTRALITLHSKGATFVTASGRNRKEILSLVMYLAAPGLAFVNPWIACGLYLLVAVIWIFPDQRIERALKG